MTALFVSLAVVVLGFTAVFLWRGSLVNSDDPARGSSWSATEQILTHVVTSREPGLWVVPASGGEPEILKLHQTGLTGKGSEAGGQFPPATPRFFPDGNRFLFFQGNSSIWSSDLSSRKAQFLISNSTGAVPAGPDLVVFSRDGLLLAQTFDTRTEVTSRLTNRQDYDADPVWGPDSARIAYSTGLEGSVRLLEIGEARDEHLFTVDRPEDSPNVQTKAEDWSSDGKTLLVRGPANRVLQVSLNTMSSRLWLESLL